MSVVGAQLEKILQDARVPYKDKNTRETWSGRLDFFFAALGYAVGLGAVWRFPYLCYKNGGGVFLIPYFIFLFLVGVPLVFLELCVGQFTSSGPLTCWQMCPIFRGVGINCVDNYSDNFTYTHCDNTSVYIKCNDGRCYNSLTSNGFNATCEMDTKVFVAWWNPTFPSQDYWNNVILQKTNDINETGHMIWQLVIALFVAWFIVFIMVFRGIKISGKLAYFTSIFPYVILLILGIRGWLLDGALEGITYYISPNFSRLYDVTVWIDAANQIFFTLSVSYGGLVALSSYNDFNNNVMADAILVSLSNCLTSVFAGFVIFSYIGYLAKQTGQSIDEVLQAGQGLAYVVYPYAVTTIKVAPLWAILFFLMMLVLGMDTMMASVEITITSFADLFPFLVKTKVRKQLAIGLLCLSLFLLGLIFCTQAGTYWVEILDSYSGGWAVLLVGALECISVTWFYGFDSFKLDIQAMLGKGITQNKLFLIWKLLWTIVSPLFLIALVILGIKDTKRLTSGSYTYPFWTEILGNLITFLTIFGVIAWILYACVDSLFITKKSFKEWLIPSKFWRPLRLEHQLLVKKIKNSVKFNEVSIHNGILNDAYAPTITRF